MPDQSSCCNLGFAQLDFDRVKRRGFPEVVFALGKDPAHLQKICSAFVKNKHDLIITKLSQDVYLKLRKKIPKLKYNKLAKIAYLVKSVRVVKLGSVVVISAGTSDVPIAEEASVILELSGNRVTRLYDVGVAGVHRVMSHIDEMRKASVIVVVAGMEGALASLVSGLVSCPVVSVPTSCGYGAQFNGLSALLSMLNSCSPGVAVMNIDNGFGAGYFANLINR